MKKIRKLKELCFIGLNGMIWMPLAHAASTGLFLSDLKVVDRVVGFDANEPARGAVSFQHNSPVPIDIYMRDETDVWRWLRRSDPRFEGHCVEVDLASVPEHAWFRIRSDYSEFLNIEPVEMKTVDGMASDLGYEEKLINAGYELVDTGDGSVFLPHAVVVSADASQSGAGSTLSNQASATPDAGKQKLLWYNSTSYSVAAWGLQTSGAIKASGLCNDTAMSSGWVFAGMGDIDKDGYDDILWHNSNSRLVAFWLLEADGYLKRAGLCYSGSMSAGWLIKGIGDLNADGTVDIIWHNSATKKVAFWLLNADGTFASSGYCTDAPMSSGWELKAMGDINGDHVADVLWHNTETKKVAYWLMNSGGTLNRAGYCYAGTMSAGWELRTTGDIKGDGSLGVFWHNAITKKVAYWFLNSDGSVAEAAFCYSGTMSNGWVLGAACDMNNDGTVDLVWHNSNTRMVAYWLMNSDGSLRSSGFVLGAPMSDGWVLSGAGS